jgi:hypothetical protein
MGTIKIQMTYDVVSPESAEHGDFADHGFYGPGGWQYSIADEEFQARCERVGREQALKDMTPEPEVVDSVEDAIDYIANYGPFEPSCYPPCDNGHCWLTQSDGDTDYSTGEVTRLALHIDGASNAEHLEIIKALI